jgi:hypothetical protein
VESTPAVRNIGKPTHRLAATINPEVWCYHFVDDPANVYSAVERINPELSPIGVSLHVVALPTIEELGESFEPQVTPHRYTAHDSGFMAFAVETDMMGTLHAVGPDGACLASIPAPEDFDGDDPNQARALTHALIDAIFDGEAK